MSIIRSVPRLASTPYERLALVAGASVLAAFVGCGGTTSSGSRGEGVTGGASGSGGSAGGRSTGGSVASNTGGRSSGGGGYNRGGTGCGYGSCEGGGCAPYFHSVSVPGACCSQCAACGPTNCPAIGCPPGQVPYTPYGQCCPTACTAGPAVDAGVLCGSATPPLFPNCLPAIDAGRPPKPACGNGRTDPGEACDGPNLIQQTCASATMGARIHGVLACSTACAIDVSGCLP